MQPSVTIEGKADMADVAHDTQVVLRLMPYPYRAMLAICSDLDETPDRQAYWDTARFLNTTQKTPMGPGVGLEVGNTIYFDMPPDQFAYWNTDDAGREMVRTLIHSGHIDALHSYGDLAARREDAGRALDELARHDCRLAVWIDHGTVATNFGADIMKGHGDEPGHTAYHADLTLGHGVRHVWRGRVTSIIGQNTPPRLGGIFTANHPVVSAKTVAKESAKRLLARFGSEKYAMHASNNVQRRIRLRDGLLVHEFLRSNPHWGGVSSCDTGKGIGQVLTGDMLSRLVDREGLCILYTHLGKACDRQVPFDESAVAAFRRLADYYRNGKILVTTTRRVLDYVAICETLHWDVQRDSNVLMINVTTEKDHAVWPIDPAGLTFYVPEATTCRVHINGKLVDNLQSNPPDKTGRSSVSVPWSKLEFPELSL